MLKIAGFLFLPFVAAAQLTLNSVTVTASRETDVLADQIVFGVSLIAPAEANLEDVLAVAAGAGLTKSDFAGLSYSSSTLAGAPVQWQFRLAAPIADSRRTAGLLSALQQNLAKDKKFTLSYAVSGTQASPKALEARNCSISGLLADARTRASNLASSAGSTTGDLQALSSAVSGGAPIPCSLTATYMLGGAQPSSETITVAAASASSLLLPDSITAYLEVMADERTGLEEVLRIVAPAGVRGQDLTTAYQYSAARLCLAGITNCSPVDWQFRITAPMAKLKETLGALAEVTRSATAGTTVVYRVSSGVSAKPECVTTTLVSQARRRAEDIAAAAGLRVGRLIALSDGPGGGSAIIPTAVFRSGDFSQTIFDPQTGYGSLWFSPPSLSPAANCSAVAQFQLLR